MVSCDSACIGPDTGRVRVSRRFVGEAGIPARLRHLSHCLGGTSGIAAKAGLARPLAFRQEPPSGPVGARCYERMCNTTAPPPRCARILQGETGPRDLLPPSSFRAQFGLFQTSPFQIRPLGKTACARCVPCRRVRWERERPNGEDLRPRAASRRRSVPSASLCPALTPFRATPARTGRPPSAPRCAPPARSARPSRP